jgi:cyclase
MLRRLIPVLLVDGKQRLVKTVSFGERTYIGDPFNVIRLFNEKEVDEIVVLDIDATVQGRSPDMGFIRELASECFIPLAYGGGITSMKHCDVLARSGIEKFVLGSSAADAKFVRELVRTVGSQAVLACVDVKGTGLAAKCVTRSGSLPLEFPLREYCRSLEDLGVGELLIQSVLRDGTRSGFDLPLVEEISSLVSIPTIALGGAGSLSHLIDGLRFGASAVASGSTFVFVGRLRAVLVTYPTVVDVDSEVERQHA